MPPTSICIGWSAFWMAFGSTSTQAGGPGSGAGTAASRRKAVTKIQSARGMKRLLRSVCLEATAVDGLRRQSLAEAALADRLNILGGLEAGASGAAAPPEEQHVAFGRVLRDVEGAARARRERLAERRIATGQIGSQRHRRIAHTPGAVGVGRRHEPEEKQRKNQVDRHEAPPSPRHPRPETLAPRPHPGPPAGRQKKKAEDAAQTLPPAFIPRRVVDQPRAGLKRRADVPSSAELFFAGQAAARAGSRKAGMDGRRVQPRADEKHTRARRQRGERPGSPESPAQEPSTGEERRGEDEAGESVPA